MQLMAQSTIQDSKTAPVFGPSDNSKVIIVISPLHSKPRFSRGRGRSEDRLRLDTWAIVNLIGNGGTVPPFLWRDGVGQNCGR